MLLISSIEHNTVIKKKNTEDLNNISMNKVINLWLVDFMLASQKSYCSGILTQAMQVFTWI